MERSNSCVCLSVKELIDGSWVRHICSTLGDAFVAAEARSIPGRDDVGHDKLLDV